MNRLVIALVLLAGCSRPPRPAPAGGPYDNVKRQAYPALLVTAAYHDTSVRYHEPAKWVARLRAHKTDPNPLLFRTDMGAASHMGKSGRLDKLRDQAFVNAFLLWQLGVVAP